MSLRINTNTVAMTAYRNLAINSKNLSKTLERLSSGLRINGAADDAAGLAIAEKMKAQTLGLKVASQNAYDGISLMQTAEGALNETEAILQRMREMAVQSANDTLTASDRSYIASELDQLSREIDRIANSTQFNSQLLLAGGSISLPGITLQIGANSGQVMNIQISTASAEALGVLITQISIDSADNASNTISRLDNAVEQVSNTRSWLGAMINRLQHTITNLDVQYENLSAAQSRIRDLDVAAEMAELTRSQILNQSSVAMLAQANQAPQSILSLLK